MTTKLFTTLTLALTLILTSLNSSAQTVASEPEPLFEIKVNNDIWPINETELADFIPSLQQIHGIDWETKSFHHIPRLPNSLVTGNKDVSLSATLRCKSPIPEEISKVIISLDFNESVPTGTLKNITLTMADDKQLTSNIFEVTIDLSGTDYYNIPKTIPFIFDQPLPNKYYSLVINVGPNKAVDWLELTNLKFYGVENNEEEILAVPEITISNTDGGNQYTISVPEGELHLLASNFSYEDEQYVFQGNVYPSTSGDIAHTETEEENWRSTVPSSNSKQLSLSANVDSSVFTKIRAKAVSGDTQSPELVTWIHQTGIATSIEEIKVTETEDNKIIWYNLQGQPTANPASGLYIRVRNGKAEKVML